MAKANRRYSEFQVLRRWMRRMIPLSIATIQRSDQQTERRQPQRMECYMQVPSQLNIELQSNPGQESSSRILKVLIRRRLGWLNLCGHWIPKRPSSQQKEQQISRFQKKQRPRSKNSTRMKYQISNWTSFQARSSVLASIISHAHQRKKWKNKSLIKYTWR